MRQLLDNEDNVLERSVPPLVADTWDSYPGAFLPSRMDLEVDLDSLRLARSESANDTVVM